MFRLLDIEFQKLIHNRASKILIISYFVLLTFIALIAAIKFDIGPIKFHLAEMGIFNFPYIWHFNTFVAALLKFFLLLVIVSMMANEYSNKTLKQNLIDPQPKKVLCFYQQITTWGMLEVYMIGVLVSVVKLYGMADIKPGIGLFCFIGVLLITALINIHFDKEQVWGMIEQGEKNHV